MICIAHHPATEGMLDEEVFCLCTKASGGESERQELAMEWHVSIVAGEDELIADDLDKFNGKVC